MEEDRQRFILNIAIGPVQQFIAQARKTRDLWFGSYLLSELSKRAAEELLQHKVELIFPFTGHIHDDGQTFFDGLKVANKLVGVVSEGDPRWIALQARRAAALRWLELAEQARQLLSDRIIRGMWERQIKDIIEFYAVWVPLGANYGEAQAKADMLLTARKKLRDFTPNEPKNLFGDKKSTLDPGRESVIDPKHLDKLHAYGIKSNETLDAVSLVKRLALHNHPESKFPSVCDVAFLPYRAYVMRNELQCRHIDDYYARLRQCFGRELRFNGSSVEDYESALFYENRISDFVGEHIWPDADNEEERDRLIQSISCMLADLYKLSVPQPKSYYAFIVCDGDRMGDHLRSLASIDDHRNLSRQLSQFASQAKQIIEEYGGQLVYSGGDDVMAYLPLTHCLQACQKLRCTFEITMQQAVPDYKRKFSLSIGMAVVHMLERIGEARRLARQAEQNAKRNRDRLAILVQKRNGGTLTNISFPFDCNPAKTMEFWITAYLQGSFSAALSYELRELYLEYDRLCSDTPLGGDEETFRTLLLREAERLADKKKPKELADETAHQDTLERIRDAFQGSGNPLEQLRMLAEQMIMAITIAKEVSYVEAVDANRTARAYR